MKAYVHCTYGPGTPPTVDGRRAFEVYETDAPWSVRKVLYENKDEQACVAWVQGYDWVLNNPKILNFGSYNPYSINVGMMHGNWKLGAYFARQKVENEQKEALEKMHQEKLEQRRKAAELKREAEVNVVTFNIGKYGTDKPPTEGQPCVIVNGFPIHAVKSVDMKASGEIMTLVTLSFYASVGVQKGDQVWRAVELDDNK